MLDFCRFSLYISPVFIITNYNSFVATESNDFKVELIQAVTMRIPLLLYYAMSNVPK